MNKKNMEIVFAYLEKHYSDATTELDWNTPFQLTVAVILSAQTTDKQVNKVTATLFNKVQHPQDIVDMGEQQFNTHIKSIGLHNSKAKNIYKLSLILVDPTYTKNMKKELMIDRAHEIYEKYGYYIPSDRKECKKLPGIGEKTAKVVLHVLYDIPLIAVDTHVHRVSNRLGIVKTKTPEQTSKIIESTIPDIYHRIAHHGFILFGRYHCIARKPACTAWANKCPFSWFCPHFKKIINKNL